MTGSVSALSGRLILRTPLPSATGRTRPVALTRDQLGRRLDLRHARHVELLAAGEMAGQQKLRVLEGRFQLDALRMAPRV